MSERFLGIDLGTQGLSVVLIDDELNVVATGDGNYQMVSGLPGGCYEQHPADWEKALVGAMRSLRGKLEDVSGIGIAGQMHGEVLLDQESKVMRPARLWCDSRNEEEGLELTHALGVKMPKRMTAVRWMWTMRNEPDIAQLTEKVTTPAGWISHRLTGKWCIGIGDASGMFPIDQSSLNYHQTGLGQFSGRQPADFKRLSDLLPEVKTAGTDGGKLNSHGASLLGLREGVPVAPAEGDQPAALAGSIIADAGTVSVSFGTSVCANSVGDKAFQGISDAVDHFCAVDGRPINMVFLRNGTTFFNTVVQMFSGSAFSEGSSFGELMQQAIAAKPDCGGLLALPFIDDEPGLGISNGGNAALIGLDPGNATAGNAIKAALLATMFNLKLGMGVLDEQGFPRTEIILTGGLTRTPEYGQTLADVLQMPVILPAGSDEGTAVGAAMLAKYRFEVLNGLTHSWSKFLARHRTKKLRRYEPDSNSGSAYELCFAKYKELLASLKLSK